MLRMYAKIRLFSKLFIMLPPLQYNLVSIIRISDCSHANDSQKIYGLTSIFRLKVYLFPKKKKLCKAVALKSYLKWLPEY